MSRVRGLLITNRVFFAAVSLRRNVTLLGKDEFSLIASALEESGQKLSFKLYGYVLMPDHWHALIGVQHPLTISRGVQDVKWIAVRKLSRHRQTAGPVWQHQFRDRFVRHEEGCPEAWKWSSYSSYAPETSPVAPCPIQID